MNKIQKQYRQGDVLVQPISAIPASATAVHGKKRVVLAEGEVSGHCHAIDYAPRQMTVFADADQLYLRVKAPVDLTHQEHSTATIEPGDYMVVRQVEVWLEEVRQVQD